MQAPEIQLFVAFIAPLFIQLAKRSQAGVLALVTREKPRILVAINAATALLTATGITFAHVPGSLTISWPSLQQAAPGLLTFLTTTLVQFAANHVAFASIYKNLLPEKPAGH
jgi:hypothetical protein